MGHSQGHRRVTAVSPQMSLLVYAQKGQRLIRGAVISENQTMNFGEFCVRSTKFGLTSKRR